MGLGFEVESDECYEWRLGALNSSDSHDLGLGASSVCAETPKCWGAQVEQGGAGYRWISAGKLTLLGLHSGASAGTFNCKHTATSWR